MTIVAALSHIGCEAHAHADLAVPSGVPYRDRASVRGFRGVRPLTKSMNITLKTVPTLRVALAA